MNEETRTMQTADTTPARAPEDAPALVKKIGKTTYKARPPTRCASISARPAPKP